MQEDKLTLANICDGAIQEKVDRALDRVARNIMDPNTDAGKARSITLKITLKPYNEDRENVAVSATVVTALAPEQAVNTNLFVSKDLQHDIVTVMEHKKGEIKGQLSFGDLEPPILPPKKERFQYDKEGRLIDTFTGEIFEPNKEESEEQNAGSVLDFRRKAQ